MGEPTFGVLGALQVRVDGVPVRVGGPKPRAVLATLLLQPSGFVSLDLLTEVLWPEGAPRSAIANVRTYVRALRRALSAAGVATDGLSTQSSGYALDVAPDDVDMLLFERLLDRARMERDGGDHAAALHGYESALGLWRGSVLQDVRSSIVWDPAITRVEELRSVAVDECLGVRLRLGDYAPLVAELRSRLSEDPLREDLWRMLARTARLGSLHAGTVGVCRSGADPRRRAGHRTERTAARDRGGGQRVRRSSPHCDTGAGVSTAHGCAGLHRPGRSDRRTGGADVLGRSAAGRRGDLGPARVRQVHAGGARGASGARLSGRAALRRPGWHERSAARAR